MNGNPHRGASAARTLLSTLICAGLFAGATTAQAAMDLPEANIVQTQGVDQSVNYAELTKYGLWDDRNYNLTAADLRYLSDTEHELSNKIPAFFRVELRKEWSHLPTKGTVQYPRAAWQLFRMRHGGFMRNGEIHGPAFNINRVPVPVSGELQLNQVLGANEITVEINPSNPQQVIAGSNNNGGQEMYYSSDGGDTWAVQGTLPNTCCDPTVGWSSDGTKAYAAALSGSIGVSFWRSFDAGQTWVDRIDLTPSGSDKEWLHVDISDSSPHQDNIYITYHNGNVMQFARSTNMGGTFDIQAFSGAPSGIGSDITTTSNGDIYYAYGAFSNQTIQVLKSTDGGLTFGTPITVASTNGNFDWPIPSMESRNAWIYVTADSDRSGGPFDGRVYLSWTDPNAPESGVAANNHTQIHVYYSDDGGATWNSSIPHPTADVLTVDRFNQWLTVDEFGTVHAVFYDTRNSVNRTGVDLYYTFSTDGAATWNELTRVSSQTSANLTDGQEWGDYNGVSVVGSKVIPVWTDNRAGPPNAKDVYTAQLENLGASPTFTLGAQNSATLTQSLCAPGNLADIGLDVGSIQGFTDPVTLAFSGLSGGFIGNFSSNPVIPGNSSTASVSVGAVAAGSYPFSITGNATGQGERSVGINVDVSDAAPGATTLSAPANGATDVSTSPTFTWAAVAQGQGYLLEVDDDPAFGSIDFSVSTGATSATLGGSLAPQTQYFWRVTADNSCGTGAASASGSFTTGAEICQAPNVSIPDNSAAGVDDPALVSATGTLASLEVKLVATHTYVGDLRFTLTNNTTGTSVTLIDRPGVPATTFGCSADNVDAVMTDSSAIPVETTCGSAPALGGELQPQSPLSAFAGEDIGGTWTLNVSDNAGIDTGTLNEWCLLPAFSGAPDSDGDGVTDDVDNCTDVANADQLDTNGDTIGNACDADLNGDCMVNVFDLVAFKGLFGTSGTPSDADLTGDNNVNVFDLVRFKQLFGQTPGPSASGVCAP